MWRKAPLSLLRFPGLFAALAVGAFLLAAATSAYPLFMSATASDLVNGGIASATVTRYGAGMLYQQTNQLLRAKAMSPDGYVPRIPEMERIFTEAAANGPDFGPVISTVIGPQITLRVSGGHRASFGNLFASTGALDHVHVLSGTKGSGVWLPETIAKSLDAHPGDSITLSLDGFRAQTIVDGIYRDLTSGPLLPYWLAWTSEVLPRGPDSPPLVRPILIDRDRFLALAPELGIGSKALGYQGSVTVGWQAPLRAGRRLTLDEAKAQVASTLGFQRAIRWRRGSVEGRLFACCSISPGAFSETRFSSYLPGVVRDAERRMAAMQAPGRLVQTAAVAVALVVIAAAGVFALAARRTETTLSFAQGEGVGSLAARTAVECLLPCLAGGAAGLAVARFLLDVVGPVGPIGSDAVRSAIAWGIGAVAASVLLLGVVAAFRYLRESAHHRTRLLLLASVPWEVGLLAAAYLAWQRIQTHGALVTDRVLKIERPSLLLVIFPLLLLTGAGLLGARLFQIAARSVRGGNGGLWPPVYLAIHRIAGGARLAVALVAASALALGIFVQAQAMVRSLQTTTDAKAGIFVGSDVKARIEYSNVVPSRFPFPMTRVVRFPSAGSLPAGADFDLLAIDPSTFARAAYWNDAFADVPLGELLRELAAPPDGTLLVILAGPTPPSIGSIHIAQHEMPVRVVATPQAFPGMSSLRPLVVVDERSYIDAFPGEFNPLSLVQASTELWIKGDEAAIQRALPFLGFRPPVVLTLSEVRDIPYILAVIDTFVVLKILGLVAALLVIAGMLMYLQARERSQIVSYGLSLRMGMSHRGHRWALVSELGAMLGSSFVVGAAVAVVIALLLIPKLDPLSAIPPGPLFLAPTAAVAATAVAIAGAAWVGGWLTNLRARRVDLGEVMRLAE